jgi:hypothetical protein
MDITLVADIPNELVLGCGKNMVQREGQLDHAQVGSEVAAVLGEHGDEFVANLCCQSLQLLHGEFLDVGGIIYHIQVAVHRINSGSKLVEVE